MGLVNRLAFGVSVLGMLTVGCAGSQGVKSKVYHLPDSTRVEETSGAVQIKVYPDGREEVHISIESITGEYKGICGKGNPRCKSKCGYSCDLNKVDKE